MLDQITTLCAKLIGAQETDDIQPVAEELQDAIRERMDRIRENAIEVAIIDRIVDYETLTMRRRDNSN